MTRFYVDRILPNGKRLALKPGGRRFFGAVTLAYLRKRAKRRHFKIVVGIATTTRQRIIAWCRWALANEAGIHYRQSRPIPLKQGAAHKLPLYTDCSGSTTIAFYNARAPDPNGRAYDGSGFTGTMRAHLTPKSLAECEPGDLIVYGPGSGSHVVIVFEAGADPTVFSHGQESGPRLYKHSVEAKTHGGIFTCHDAGC